MAQLRQDYEKFVGSDVEIIAVGPENGAAFRKYWEEHNLPFLGLPDPKHKVLKLYGQQIKLFKFGRMPAQVIIDKSSIARYIHYGHDMRDIPSNKVIFSIFDHLNSRTV